MVKPGKRLIYGEIAMESIPPYLLLDTAVISGKESSKRTCSCSSTKYTPVQLTATITSFLGRLGPRLKTRHSISS